MSDIKRQLLERITARQARVGVVGLGYVGLPLAVEFARSGLVCTGIDVDARKVATILAGDSYIPDVQPADVQNLLTAPVGHGGFGAVAELDTINICVPTPLRKTKDLTCPTSCPRWTLTPNLRPGTLVVLE
jgi:UDP-N-acetyl-D-glucosamine dehydrogenase